jgi:hypothetical protein
LKRGRIKVEPESGAIERNPHKYGSFRPSTTRSAKPDLREDSEKANAKKQELSSHGSAPQLLQCFLVSNYADCAGFAGYAGYAGKISPYLSIRSALDTS